MLNQIKLYLFIRNYYYYYYSIILKMVLIKLETVRNVWKVINCISTISIERDPIKHQINNKYNNSLSRAVYYQSDKISETKLAMVLDVTENNSLLETVCDRITSLEDIWDPIP